MSTTARWGLAVGESTREQFNPSTPIAHPEFKAIFSFIGDAGNRYLGNEFGAIHKPWGDATIRFSLTYPEVYEVGASNLGHIVLYTVLNDEEGMLCDRSYMPADDMQALLTRMNKPLFAVESKRPLGDFDTLGFSLAYELGATNVLQMLTLSGIPLSAKERLAAEPGAVWDCENGSHPLIFAGELRAR